MKYAIKADYYMWSEEKGEHTEELYLALEGPKKLFVFEEDITERTKLFDTAREAGEYIDARDSLNGKGMRMSFKSLKIVEVKEN